jgi:hypothetical protein
MKKKKQRNLMPLWGRLIHSLWDGCAMRDNSFGDTCAGGLQAHHLISRSRKGFRHDPRNGILLCCKHHTFSKVVSPHSSPVAFAGELRRRFPWIVEWVLVNSNKEGSTQDEQEEMINGTTKELERNGRDSAFGHLWNSQCGDVFDFPIGDGCRAKSIGPDHTRVAMGAQERKRGVLAVAKDVGQRVWRKLHNHPGKRNARTPGVRRTRSKEEIESGWGLHVQ